MKLLRPWTALLAVLVFSACDAKAPLLPVPVGEPFASIAAGGHTTCALTTSGRAFCWGRGTSGQLGNGGTASHARPVPVATALRFVELSVGYYHTCGLVADGTAYCWGARGDEAGQLGAGSGTRSSVRPVRVDTRQRFRQISAGQVHTCAVTAEGVAHCWGGNMRGQLGDGSGAARSAPTRVSGGRRFTGIGSGALHTCGSTAEGAVLCWGDNFFGSVTGDPNAHTPDTCRGTGDARCTLAPYRVEASELFVTVAAGDGVSCGLTGTDGWWCWGGSSREPLPARAVSSVPTAASLVVGGGHACVRTDTGSVLCRGANNLGQLGIGNETIGFSMEALPVDGGHTFRSVAVGMFHTCAVDDAGSPYCWGGNRDGQLGHGSPHTCDSSYPCARSPQPVRTR